jgi:hypothetical protein
MEKMKVTYAPRGKRGEGRRQKPIVFRLDPDLIEWMNGKPNKNLYINGLIRKDKIEQEHDND